MKTLNSLVANLSDEKAWHNQTLPDDQFALVDKVASKLMFELIRWV